MNPADLHELIVASWGQLNLAITAGVVIVLGAVIVTLAVREVGNSLKVRFL